MSYKTDYKTTVKRLYKKTKVQKMDNGDICFLYQGTRNTKGYGFLCVGGKNRLVHRLASEHFIDDIPKGKLVCHTCDNPNCIHPNHLFIGTNRDNIIDAANKGRLRNQNKGKVHCIRGHAFDEKNTYYKKNGQRECRACKMDWFRKKRASIRKGE